MFDVVHEPFWPRGACLSYAAILVSVVLPLYLLGLPREEARQQGRATSNTPRGQLRPDQRVAFVLLAAAFILASVIMTVIACASPDAAARCCNHAA